MSMRIALEQLNPALREQVKAKLAAAGGSVVDVRPIGIKPSKHHARAVRADGIRFDSRHEHRCYLRLKLREKAGEIEGLRCHVKFALFDVGEQCKGELIGTYTADFAYREGGKLVVADAKSEHTRTLPGWTRTKKLMRMCHGHEVVEL